MPPRGSPGKGKAKLGTDMTPLALPALLKLLTSSGPRPPHLDMRQAMQAASKLVPKGYTSEGKLRLLTGADLAQLGIADDDLRKALLAVISGKASGAGSAKGKAAAAGDGAAAAEGDVRRKRARDSDLDKPLPTRAPKGDSVDEDFQFDEIEAEEALVKKFCLTNRAPVMTAWACVVAERLGFRRQEALSIAHVFTDMNATSKGVSLGLMSADALKVAVGPSQPFVEILGRKVPVLSTQNGEWRAISKGLVADPGKAFAYMRNAFRQQLGAVVGSMRLLADSFSPAELNTKGYGLYLDFRPDVDGWGKKAELRMSTILGLRRFLTHAPVDDAPEASGSQKEEDEEERAREVKQEVDGADAPVRVKAEPEDDAGGVEPVTKRVKREEDGGEDDVKPSVVAAEDEFDALLAEDDDLFAAVDL
ncbi:hypothetical protein JCM3775_004228 [Rhodotorula graminis]